MVMFVLGSGATCKSIEYSRNVNSATVSVNSSLLYPLMADLLWYDLRQFIYLNTRELEKNGKL